MDFEAYNNAELRTEGEKKEFDVINKKGLKATINDIVIEEGKGKREGHDIVKMDLVVIDDEDYANRRLWPDFDLDHEVGARIFRQAIHNIDTELGKVAITDDEALQQLLQQVKPLTLVIDAFPSKPAADGKIWQRVVIKGQVEEEVVEMEDLNI